MAGLLRLLFWILRRLLLGCLTAHLGKRAVDAFETVDRGLEKRKILGKLRMPTGIGVKGGPGDVAVHGPAG